MKNLFFLLLKNVSIHVKPFCTERAGRRSFFPPFGTLSDEVKAGLTCVCIAPVEVMEFRIA